MKILWPWLSAKFILLLMSLLPAQIVKNSNIFASFCFIFSKNVLYQTWKSFNTKFRPQWKDQKNSYQAEPILKLFCDLVSETFS